MGSRGPVMWRGSGVGSRGPVLWRGSGVGSGGPYCRGGLVWGPAARIVAGDQVWGQEARIVVGSGVRSRGLVLWRGCCMGSRWTVLWLGSGVGPGGEIASIFLPECPQRRLKGRWRVSVANSITAESHKDDELLQPGVLFVPVASLKDFAVSCPSQTVMSITQPTR